MLHQLFQNATLLVTLIMLYSLLSRIPNTNVILRKWLTGILFGAIAIAAMNMPFTQEPGIIYDGRSIVLTLAGLFGGFIPGAIAVVMASAFRIYLGGAGIYAGMATIVLCTLIGILFRRYFKNKPENISLPGLIGIGIISHIIMLASQLLLPSARALKVISDIWIPIMLLFPFFFMLIAYFLSGEINKIYTGWKLSEAQQLAGLGHYTFYIKSGNWTCSKGLDDIFGIDKKYKRNRENWMNIVHPDTREDVEHFFLFKNMKECSKFDITYKIIEKKGEKEKWVRNLGKLKYNGDDASAEIFGTIQDITATIESENTIRRQAQIVDQVHDSIITTDLNGSITWCNKGAERLHGYNIHEVTGKHISLLVPMEYSLVFNEHLERRINESGDYQFEVQMKKKSGGLFYANVSLSLLTDSKGNKEGIIAYAIDFTRQKQLEYNLKQSNEEYLAINEELNESLERIQHINTELEEAKEKAEESDRLKTAFLTNMSHEIRTPMNGIMGFTSLLKNKNLTNEDKVSFLDIIERSSRRLLSTIDDLIDISRIESGIIKIEEKNTSIRELFDEIDLLFRIEIEKQGLRFEIKNRLTVTEEIITTDKEKLYTVITNLINNAKKFTTNGYIETGCYTENDSIIFYVKDSGVGISKNKQTAIFDRFVQEEMHITRPYEGSGLGLSISKAFVEMLEGKIWVESSKGKGSCFYFSLPFKKMKEAEPKSSVKNAENDISLQNLTVLVVEDDEISFKYFENILADSIKKIYHARTGIEAIEFFRNNKNIDLILMDIKLPEMDGYEVTRRIKQISPETPVIAQTAFASDTDWQKAIKAGCSDYISKPVNSTMLIEKIKRIFSERNK